MEDTTQTIRAHRQAEINAAAADRESLSATYGQVWDTAELTAEFEVIGFLAPFVVVQSQVRPTTRQLGVSAPSAVLLQLRPRSALTAHGGARREVPRLQTRGRDRPGRYAHGRSRIHAAQIWMAGRERR